MKKIFLLASLIVLTFNLAQAKIWRVNNNPGGFNANFTTLQAAHDGAAANDTIFLESSPTSYGALSCSKKLVIMGVGYYLAENNIGGVSTLTSKVDGIQMNAGSQNSELMGLDFNGSAVYIYTSNIKITRNKFNSSNGSGSSLAEIIYGPGTIYLGNSDANNIIITQNYGLMLSGPSYTNTGILIMNNLFAFYGYYGTETYDGLCFDLNQYTTALIQNNIFVRGRVRAHRSSFTNNIMLNGYFDKGEAMAANNIANGTQFGSTDGNQANVNMSNVFVGTGSPDARFKLKIGSPAIGGGYGSTSGNVVDCGMYYGNTPYKISGLPGVPVIYFINVQAVGSNTDPIDVTVKVKSTN